MKQQVSLPIQIAAIAVLFGVAAALWLGREQVTSLYVSMTGTQKAAKKNPQKAGSRPAPVVVDTVRRMANDAVIEAIATARAKQSVTLYPETTGVIAEILVTPGQRIARGDVVLRLNSRLATLAVNLARTRVAAAERQLQRAESLLQSNVNSSAQVEDAANALAQANIELEQAEAALNERTLKAPFGGVVGIPTVELGDRVTPESGVVTLDDRSALYVELEVPEQYLARLKLGQKIRARSTSFAERAFEGVVAEIDSRIDPVTRSMMVRAELNNEDDTLRPGMSFAVELSLPGKSYAAVPELAVQWRKGESFVWVVSDKLAKRVAVRSVKRLNSFILLDGAVSEGDLVVIEGVQRLRDGSTVSFPQPQPAPAVGS